jgi:tRNA A37 threonylcarbamoyladenosine biosynthesis protein TsaE
MTFNTMHDSLMCAVYFAPRGKERLLNLGHQIAQRYLSPSDRLIGLIGDSGAGKSLLINGMFPGLELSNDDEGINVRPLPLIKSCESDCFRSHTYHIDARFELAFTQMHVIVNAVKEAVEAGKRVVVEHFDQLSPYLDMNAEMLIGIGEEVIITRPNIFGPKPKEIAEVVFNSIKYRKMAHTAEDLVTKVLREEMGPATHFVHSDVRHGFVLESSLKPNIDIIKVEKKVLEYIDAAMDVQCEDEAHILIDGCGRMHCTGPRIHVKNTSEILNFELVKEFKYNPILKTYALVGLVGNERAKDLSDLNTLAL